MRMNNSGRFRKAEYEPFAANESVVKKLKPTFHPKLKLEELQRAEQTDRVKYTP